MLTVGKDAGRVERLLSEGRLSVAMRKSSVVAKLKSSLVAS
jgi:hypothetical protein